MNAQSIRGKNLFKNAFLNYGIYMLLLLAVVIMSLMSANFLTFTNIINILLQNVVIGVVAIGMTFVIATDGIDLSAGAVMAISCGAGIGLIKLYDCPWWIGVLVMVGVGLLFGLVNGFAVSYMGIPQFLVTLATQNIARGLTLVLSGGKSWYDLPKQITVVASSSFLGIPMLLWILVGMFVVFHVILKRTVYGRKVLAIGANPEAARVSGINVKLVRMSAYTLCGALCGLAAILQCGRMNSFWASMGTDLEFSAISAVVIGGTSLKGGKASLFGTLAGVVLMGIISNALNLLNVEANWQQVARGIIIFIAVALDALRSYFNRVS